MSRATVVRVSPERFDAEFGPFQGGTPGALPFIKREMVGSANPRDLGIEGVVQGVIQVRVLEEDLPNQPPLPMLLVRDGPSEATPPVVPEFEEVYVPPEQFGELANTLGTTKACICLLRDDIDTLEGNEPQIVTLRREIFSRDAYFVIRPARTIIHTAGRNVAGIYIIPRQGADRWPYVITRRGPDGMVLTWCLPVRT